MKTLFALALTAVAVLGLVGSARAQYHGHGHVGFNQFHHVGHVGFYATPVAIINVPVVAITTQAVSVQPTVAVSQTAAFTPVVTQQVQTVAPVAVQQVQTQQVQQVQTQQVQQVQAVQAPVLAPTYTTTETTLTTVAVPTYTTFATVPTYNTAVFATPACGFVGAHVQNFGVGFHGNFNTSFNTGFRRFDGRRFR